MGKMLETALFLSQIEKKTCRFLLKEPLFFVREPPLSKEMDGKFCACFSGELLDEWVALMISCVLLIT